MSRLFPDRVVVELAPSHIFVSRWRSLHTPRSGQVATPCDTAAGPEPWRGSVATLSDTQLGRCRLSVVLSSHFVRHALVPWSSAIATAEEEQLYVRHHFVRVHGQRAKDWAVRASEAAPGAPRLATAVDAALIHEIKAAARRQPGVRLVSIQPRLMSRFNAWRGAIPASGAWVVVAEEDGACIALHGRDGWQSVQSAKGDWHALLERERLRMEGDIPDLVLLGGASAPNSDGAWAFREMGG